MQFMKPLIIFLLFVPLGLLSQDNDLSNDRDTIFTRYSARYTSTSTTIGIRQSDIKEGFNQIYSIEDGLLISEGYIKKRSNFKLKLLLRYIKSNYPLKKPVRTGLWTLYSSDGKLYGQVTYDKKGNKVGELYFYPNGSIKEIRYRESHKAPWLIERVYSKEGQIIDKEGEWNDYSQTK